MMMGYRCWILAYGEALLWSSCSARVRVRISLGSRCSVACHASGCFAEQANVAIVVLHAVFDTNACNRCNPHKGKAT